MITKEKISKSLSIKELRAIASTLPVVAPLTCEKHWVDGAELIAQGHTENTDGSKFIAGRMYEQRFPVVLAVNHFKRLKKMYNQYGDAGVVSYINVVNQENIINNELTSKA